MRAALGTLPSTVGDVSVVCTLDWHEGLASENTGTDGICKQRRGPRRTRPRSLP